jgi:hypothetical protein
MGKNVRRFTRTCEICGTEFLAWHLQNKFCSEPCFKLHVSRRRTKISEEIVAKALTQPVGTDVVTWLMEATGAARHTVYQTLRRHNVTFFPRPRVGAYNRALIMERTFARDTGCIVCGEKRVVDAAHLIPAKCGGAGWIPNIIPLCPNHHRIYDKECLTDAECQNIVNWLIQEFDASNFTAESFENCATSLGDLRTDRRHYSPKSAVSDVSSGESSDSKTHG